MIAILDCRTPPSAQELLRQRGYEIILLPPHPALPSPVASHPDLLLFFTESLCFTVKSYAGIADKALHKIAQRADRKIVLCDEDLGGRYPNDILLDAARIGQYLLCSPAHTSKKLVEQFHPFVIPVRQGYAKCSCIPVSDRALITADPSIGRAAKAVGLDVLMIGTNGVSLPGYDTGFIGGAASFQVSMNRNEIYFCGDLDRHPSGASIRQFCQRYGKAVISLGDFPLIDVGTMFLL